MGGLRYIFLFLGTVCMAAAAVAQTDDRRSDCRQAAAYPIGDRGVRADNMDVDRAIAICREALARYPGDTSVMAWLARALHVGGVSNGEPDFINEAFRLAEYSANAGNAEGMFKLGSMFERGDGVAADKARAVELYRQSANQGFLPALDYMIDVNTSLSGQFVGLTDMSELRPLAERLLEKGQEHGYRQKAVVTLITVDLFDMLNLSAEFHVDEALVKYETAKGRLDRLSESERGALMAFIDQQAQPVLEMIEQADALKDAGLPSVRALFDWVEDEANSTSPVPPAFRNTAEWLADRQDSPDGNAAFFANTALQWLELKFAQRTSNTLDLVFNSDLVDRPVAYDHYLAALADQRFVAALRETADRGERLTKLDAQIAETEARKTRLTRQLSLQDLADRIYRFLDAVEMSREEQPTDRLIKRMQALLAEVREVDGWEEAEGWDLTDSVQLGYSVLALGRLSPTLDVLTNHIRSNAPIPDKELAEARLLFPFLDGKVDDIAGMDKARTTILEAEARTAALTGDHALAVDKYEALYREKMSAGEEPAKTQPGELPTEMRQAFENAARVAADTSRPAKERLQQVIDGLRAIDRGLLAYWLDETSYSFEPEDEVHALLDGAIEEVSAESVVLATLADLLFLGADTPEDADGMVAIGEFFESDFGYWPSHPLMIAWERVMRATRLRINALGARAVSSHFSGKTEVAAINLEQMRHLVETLYEPGSRERNGFRVFLKSLNVGGNVHDISTDKSQLAAHRLTRIRQDFMKGRDSRLEGDPRLADTNRMSPEETSRDVDAKLEAVSRIGRVPLDDIELDLFYVQQSDAMDGGYIALANRISSFAADYYRSFGEASDVASHLSELARGLQYLGAYDDAFATYQDALATLARAGKSDTPQYESIAVDLLAFSASTGNRKAVERTTAAYEGQFAASLAGSFGRDDSEAVASLLWRQAIERAAVALENEAAAKPQPVYPASQTGRWISLLDQVANFETENRRFANAKVAVSLLDFIEITDPFGGEPHEVRQVEARIAYLQGNYAEAARLQRQLITDLAAAGQIQPETRPFALAPFYLRLAQYDRATGDSREALKVARNAYAIASERLGAENPAIAAFAYELSIIFGDLGMKPEQYAELKRAFDLVHEPGTGFLYRNIWTSGNDDSVSPIRIAGAWLDGLWHRYRDDGDERAVATAFESLQTLANRQASEAILDAASRGGNVAPEVAKLIRRRQDLLREIGELRNELATKPVDVVQQFNFDRLQALQSELDGIIRTIAANNPDLGLAGRQTAISIEEVRRHLGEDEAVLIVRDLDISTHVMLIGRNFVSWHRSELAGDELADSITALRLALVPDPSVIRGVKAIMSDRRKDFAVLSAALYHEIFEPVFSEHKAVDHLIVSANAPLDAIPLQILVTTPKRMITSDGDFASLDWLLEDYAVTVVPALAGITSIRSRTPTDKPFLGVGAPLFAKGAETRADAKPALEANYRTLFRSGSANLEAIAQLDPLPESEFEVRFLSERLGGRQEDLLFGAHASEAEIRLKPLEDYRVIAFATHGLLAGELGSLAEPALVLTPGSTEDRNDDGLLTMSEVAELKLNADWVVLSACNTAGDDGRPGSDAFSGLTQAFLYAGARNIIVSHWPVNTNAAVELTTGMANHLRDSPNLPLAEAMRRAMLDLLAAGKRDPAYWAPFSIISSGASASSG